MKNNSNEEKYIQKNNELEKCKELIPKSKFDDKNIDKILELNDEQFKYIALDLLEWIQDINWPISNKIINVLSLRQNIIDEYIIKLLKKENEDNIWKYNIILYLIPEFKKEINIDIINELKRINSNPTEGEKLEEVNLVSNEICQKLNF